MPTKLERAKAWNAAHPDRVRENQRRYCDANKARIKSQREVYQATEGYKTANRERLAAWRKAQPWSNLWQAAKQRCENPSNPKYKRYGGRGIRCLLSKADFEFLWARDKAPTLKSPSIDRIDNDGNYTRENCHFIERAENSSKRDKPYWKHLINTRL